MQEQKVLHATKLCTMKDTKATGFQASYRPNLARNFFLKIDTVNQSKLRDIFVFVYGTVLIGIYNHFIINLVVVSST